MKPISGSISRYKNLVVMRGRKPAIVLVKLIFMLALLAPTAMGAASQDAPDAPEIAWEDYLVDGPAHFALMTDRFMRLDSDDNPCMAYGGDRLFYSCYNATTEKWDTEVVDGDYLVGSHAALAFNHLDQPFISYFDAHNGDLKLAYNLGAGWLFKVIDNPVALAKADSGPEISDLHYSDLLNYTPLSPNGTLLGSDPALALPSFTGEPKGAGKFTSIAIDSYGWVHISYYDDYNEADGKGRLKYALWKGIGDAFTEVVDDYHDQGDTGLWTSIAIDHDDHPHIAYMDDKYDDLRYARERGGTWDHWTVHSNANVGSGASLALDSTGRPHISYLDFGNYNLNYAYMKLNGDWAGEPVDTGSAVGMYSSIALDEDDKPHISYMDLMSGDLKYARMKSTGSWSRQTVESEGYTGKFTSIALDDGVPRIAYLNVTEGHVKFASWDGADDEWDIDALTEYESGDVGLSTSLAMDSRGVPHISYMDNIRGNLKFARAVGLTWDLGFIADDINAGAFSSVKMRHDYQPVVAFYDELYGDLLIAIWNGAYWEIDEVQTENDVGQYVSLAIDSNGDPHMSYYDATYQNLRYAYWDGDEWITLRLDHDGEVGKFTSIALDSADRPVITYYDHTEETLMIAVKTPINAWVFLPIDDLSPGDDGIQVYEVYNSLALDSSDLPQISYYDEIDKELMFAYYDAGWTLHTMSLDNSGDMGKFNSMAVDINPANLDDLHICYYDETDGDLEYAFWDDSAATWAFDTVRDMGNTGMYCSIAVSPDSVIGISFYDYSLGDLRYASSAVSPKIFNESYSVKENKGFVRFGFAKPDKPLLFQTRACQPYKYPGGSHGGDELGAGNHRFYNRHTA